MYVTKEAIERVRRSLDLVAVVEGRGVKLVRPSLVVNPGKQPWHCFGACGSSGGGVYGRPY